jgi:hypothetical protein
MDGEIHKYKESPGVPAPSQSIQPGSRDVVRWGWTMSYRNRQFFGAGVAAAIAVFVVIFFVA